MAWLRRLFLGLATIALLGLPAAACAASSTQLRTSSEAAAETLAHTYAPITMLREQQNPPCETTLINLLGALIFSLLLPYVVIAQTLLYFDLQARAT